MHKWLQAAARYEAAKKPGFKKRRKQHSQKPADSVPSLSAFLLSEEGEVAKKLLAAADRFILLGESEAAMSQSTSVSLDGGGLKRSSQVVGMAAAYTKKQPEMETIDVNEALNLLHFFRDDGYEDEIVLHIRKELDRIAEDAP